MEAIYRRARETGALNLCNRSLDSMPKELLKWTDLVYEKQDWWLLEPLKQLNLSQNELTSFDATEEQLKMLAHQLHRCNLAHNAFQSIPAKFLEYCTLLVNLDLQHNNITEVPESINFCSNLSHLNLSHNKLTSVPPLSALKSLVVFNASNNALTVFPKLPADCSSLARLDLSFNRLQNLPGDFGAGLPNLVHLELSDNYIETIPETLGNMDSLVFLSVSRNNISETATFTGILSSLKELYIGFNKLEEFPRFLVGPSSPPNVVILDIQENRLKSIPDDALSGSSKIERINLFNNSLDSVSGEMVKIQSLRGLDIRGNPLRTLKRGAENMSPSQLLEYLRMKYQETQKRETAVSAQPQPSPARQPQQCPLQQLQIPQPESQKQQQTQQSQENVKENAAAVVVPKTENHEARILKDQSNVASKQLGKIAKPELPKKPQGDISAPPLPSSGTLDLSKKKLTDLPEPIIYAEQEYFDKVTKLNLEGNMIASLSQYVASFSNLKILDITSNKMLASLPASLVALQDTLAELHLCNNRLGPKFPSVICSLTSLIVLDIQGVNLPDAFSLSANHLEEIDPRVSQLRQLETVKLDTNSLETFPKAFASLPNIKTLSMSYNSMKNINSDELRHISPTLTSLNMEYNDLRNIPNEFGDLSHITAFGIDGNRIVWLKRPLIQKGTSSVFSYLRQRMGK